MWSPDSLSDKINFLYFKICPVLWTSSMFRNKQVWKFQTLSRLLLFTFSFNKKYYGTLKKYHCSERVQFSLNGVKSNNMFTRLWCHIVDMLRINQIFRTIYKIKINPLWILCTQIKSFENKLLKYKNVELTHCTNLSYFPKMFEGNCSVNQRLCWHGLILH